MDEKSNMKDDGSKMTDGMMDSSDERITQTGVKDRAKVIEHLRDHVSYPATSSELIETCNNMADISAEDKKWFTENLPEDTYASAEEVMEVLMIDNVEM